jgi:hypothetical protein
MISLTKQVQVIPNEELQNDNMGEGVEVLSPCSNESEKKTVQRHDFKKGAEYIRDKEFLSF